jgi:hypothetical protein
MTIEHNIDLLGVEDKEHLVKGELIEKLSPYYH